MDIESVKKYFNHNNIPYQTNIMIICKTTNDQTVIQFVLPNAVLQIFNPTAPSYRPRIIQKKLERILSIVPEKYVVYALVDKSIVDIDVICDKCGIPEEDENESIIAKRVNFITDVSQIIFDDFKYYCYDNGIIRSLGSFYFEQYEKYLDLFVDKLYIPKREYLYSITIMTDVEIERLHTFKPRIVDNMEEIDGIVIIIKNSKYIKKSQTDITKIIATPYIEVKKCGLTGFDSPCRRPLRVIEGVTYINDDGTITYSKKYKEFDRVIDSLTLLSKSEKHKIYNRKKFGEISN